VVQCKGTCDVGGHKLCNLKMHSAVQSRYKYFSRTKDVMFLVRLFVCLSLFVCLFVLSLSARLQYTKRYERISMKFFGGDGA